MNSTSLGQHGPQRLKQFVNRRNALDAIRAAIDDYGQRRVIAILGEGGYGKTRLLEEVESVVSDQTDETHPCRCPELIDLAFSRTHTILGIEESIVKAIGMTPDVIDCFKEYRDRLQEYERAVGGKASDQSVRKIGDSLRDLFIKGFNAFSDQQRVVLRFDTVEALANGIDGGMEEYQEIGEYQEIAEALRSQSEVVIWLKEQLPRLENLVLLLAGRPEAKGLLEGVAGLQIESLEQFSDDDAMEYLDAWLREFSANERNKRPALISLVHGDQFRADIRMINQSVEGNPILLAAILELCGDELAQPMDFNRSERNLSVLDMLEEVFRRIETKPEFQRLYEFLKYMGPARKGANAELLSRFSPWPEDECCQALKESERLVLIKTRTWPGAGQNKELRYYLHDVVYDLMDKLYGDFRGERPGIFRDIISYYDQELEALEHQAKETSLPERLKSERESLELERLHYKLRDNPEVRPVLYGPGNYSGIIAEALENHDVSYSLLLREEFLQTWKLIKNTLGNRAFHDSDQLFREIVRGELLRQVRRLNAGEQFEQAAKVGVFTRELFERRAWPFSDLQPEEDDYEFALMLQIGEAEVIGGSKLRDGIALLNDEVVTRLSPKLETASDERQKSERASMLGRAHNLIGYAYRLQQQYRLTRAHYGKAVSYLREAVPHESNPDGTFPPSVATDRLADVLKDLAYLHSIHGSLDEAERLIEESRYWYSRSPINDYGLALCNNVMGLIQVRRGRPDWGVAYCGQAKLSFEGIHDSRGEGLAERALGFAKRRLARTAPGLSADGRQKELQEGISCLQRSIRSSREFGNRLDLAEAYSELGCLCRDWHRLYESDDVRSDSVSFDGASVLCQELARRFFGEAIQEVKDQPLFTGTYFDVLENLAELEVITGHKDEAKLILERIEEELVGANEEVRYVIMPWLRLDSHSEMAITGHWLVLGKCELLRARMAADPPYSDHKKAVEHLVLASEYFHAFSAEATETSQIAQLFWDILIRPYLDQEGRYFNAEKWRQLILVAKNAEGMYQLQETTVVTKIIQERLDEFSTRH